jgi:hypothetical protein
MIGWIGFISRHLGSLLGVIELTILCAFVCKVGNLDAHITTNFTIQVGLTCLFGKMLLNFIYMEQNYKIICIPHHFL